MMKTEISLPAPVVSRPVAVPASRVDHADWLRVLAMLAVFIFHCGRFFDDDGWHVKSEVQTLGFTLFNAFIAQWIMPVFFLLAGAGSFFALRTKSNGAFLRARSLRLLVPYAMGILLLIPPQKYLEALHYGNFSGSFWAFLPGYFAHRFFPPHAEASLRIFGHWGYHLWFLPFLFIFSLVLIPLAGPLSRWRIRSSLPSFLTLAIVVTALIQFVLRPFFSDYLQWTDTLFWLVFFLFGFRLYREESWMRTIRRYRNHALVTGVIIFGALLAWFFSGHLRQVERENTHSLYFALLMILKTVNTWAWVLFFLGTAAQRLNFRNGFLRYANEAVLPFYVFHQTVILLIGYFVIKLPLGLAIQYVLIILLSFLAVMVLYEGCRQGRLTRFLLGMKSR